jgi:hypothetical protein
MGSEPSDPASPPDLLRELGALLPEVMPALGSLAGVGIASLLTSPPTVPEIGSFERERFKILLRHARDDADRCHLEINDLASKLRAKERENEQLQRVARASAQQTRELRALQRRLARSNGASTERAELPTYAWCCRFHLLPEPQRPKASRALRAQYLRVAKMSPLNGRALDEEGIAFRWIRYAAYGDGPYEQKVRAAQVLAGCRPRRELNPHRDLSVEVAARLAWSSLADCAAQIRRLIKEGQGAAFLGGGAAPGRVGLGQAPSR